MRNSSSAEARPSLWNSVAAKWLGDGPMLGFGIHDSILDKTTRWWMIPVANNGINDNLVGCFNFQCLFFPVFWDVWLTSIWMAKLTTSNEAILDTCKECSCSNAWRYLPPTRGDLPDRAFSGDPLWLDWSEGICSCLSAPKTMGCEDALIIITVDSGELLIIWSGWSMVS